MLVTSTAGAVAPDAYCVSPSVLPAVPRFIVMVLAAAPSFHPEMPIVAGVALAKEPSLLKTTAIDPDVEPVGVLVGSDDSVGSPKPADQLLSAVFFHVTWTVFAVPSESYTDIELVNVAPMAASAGRFAAIVVE